MAKDLGIPAWVSVVVALVVSPAIWAWRKWVIAPPLKLIPSETLHNLPSLFSCSFDVVNIGRTVATLKEVYLEYGSADNPMARERAPIAGERRVHPGEKAHFDSTLDGATRLTASKKHGLKVCEIHLVTIRSRWLLPNKVRRTWLARIGAGVNEKIDTRDHIVID